ncbi:MAG: McrB family protein [Phaeodactylibacter xiamenensis]|uniref:ATPase dynein-related AAA domain-containing protein n=1 Tax=Phaeodactylibacter xiamenensis TaxID=1524460 RepID=A0A098S3C8_9BACT|nr:AAA family ATPase [Phaeodactylibacter xiamenensis]KGE85707.1 hypothetical protein IX84_26925 [Phaeodactylibacter xiamenensis]MCR9051993.1 AAA family ATPase [bacterium]
MEFFSQRELSTFSTRASTSYDKNKEEDKKQFTTVRTLYDKLGYLAEQIQEAAFPEGAIKIRRNPLNTTGTIFMPYLWAQVYPTKELAEQKALAFTVSIDAKRYVDIKIDTVGLKDDDPIRKQYLKWRGDIFNSDIVKLFSFEDVLTLDWEQLISQMAKAAKGMLKDYHQFNKTVDRKEENRDSFIQEEFALNQILYGPPGTGKTYRTKNIAVQILNGTPDHSREEIKRQYDDLYKQGRIRFMTFHQGTTYEDFIEGIKPVLSADQEEEDSTVNYVIEDGVFKRMCVEASQEYVKLQSQEQSSVKTLTFSQLYDGLVSQFEERLEHEETIAIPQKSGSPINVVGTSSKGNLLLKHEDGQREYTASKSRLEKLFNAIDDFDNLPNIYSFFREVIGGSNASANWAVLNQIYKLKNDYSQDKKTAPQKSISYSDKLRAFERIDWSKVNPDQDVPKYLLIIDEINRGNVAAVLGELITLLEADKRGGATESLEVTLPYSKSNFAVPPNLYLIGTMNTADRSVEALDTALRRRFSFTEVGPKPELLSPKAMILSLLNREAYADLGWEEEPYHSHARKLYDFLGVAPDGVEEPLRERAEVGEGYWEKSDLEHLSPDDFTGVKLNHLLGTINLRIARLIDRDHMIGHAYFMGIATAPDPWQALKEVFHRNILPLLQEYFFGDYAKIGLVLGNGFVGVEEAREGDVFADFPYEASADLATQTQYTLKDVSRMSIPDFQEAVWGILPNSNTGEDG